MQASCYLGDSKILGKDVEVRAGYGLLDKMTVGTHGILSHSAVFTPAQQQIAKGIANVGVFVLVGGVSEPFLPCADSYALEVVAASQGFPQEFAGLVHNQAGFTLD
jgi:hypothetical protein